MTDRFGSHDPGLADEAVPPGEHAPTGGAARPARIEPAIRRFVAHAFRDGDPSGLGDDVPLVTSGLVDSAGVLEVVAFLEERFGIEVPDEDLVVEHFDTIAALAAYVRDRAAADDGP